MELTGLQITPDCWIDLFDAPHFNGQVRRIFGPALYLNLRNSDPDHPVRYASLIVGPVAYAQLFTQRRAERGAVWLIPRQKLADLSSMKMEQELDSIRILNRPPFRYEQGYSAFVRQLGRHHPEAPRQRRKRRGRKKS